MSISINLKADTSYLFSSFSNSNSNSGSGVDSLSSILSDYSSIKNGSYGKLLKAYYGTNTSSSVSSIVDDKTASEDDAATISKLKSSASELKAASDELMKTEEDPEKMYKAVSDFTDKYNNMVKTAVDSNNQRILTTAANMTTSTVSNRNLLEKIGVKINDDNTLSVDEEKFKAADMSTVKTLFGTHGSYAYGISTKASFIEMYAKSDAQKTSGLYGQNASYDSAAVSSGYNFYSYI